MKELKEFAMEIKDAEFLKKLLALFKIEAREHLDVIASGLSGLQKTGAGYQLELVESVYREAHTLKGAARSVNLADIVALCQSMENVFSALKRDRLPLSPQAYDLLQQAVDSCHSLVDDDTSPAAGRADIGKLIRRLDGAIAGKAFSEPGLHDAGRPEEPQAPKQDIRQRVSPGPDRSPPPSDQTPPAGSIPATSETIRISTASLDAILLQAEEMIAFKLATAQRMTQLQDLRKMFNVWKKRRRDENAGKIPPSDDPGCRFPADPAIPAFERQLTDMVRAAAKDHRTSAIMIDMLLDDIKKTLMLPFSSMLEVFPRFVRDLARQTGKQVELTLEGGNFAVDKRVLEEMKDALIQLVKNCCDHGIEPPDERKRKNKPCCGSVTIDAVSRDGRIEIVVEDDGRGLDTARIKSSAVTHTGLSQEEVHTLGEQEVLQLIFRSGVTTSPLITDTSGRGLGLAIAKEKVEKLNGSIRVATRTGAGTTFHLLVPLTLATFRGTLIRVSGQLFILPSTRVERVVRVKKEAIQTVENCETLVIEGRPVSLVHLGDALEPKATGNRRQPGDAFLHVVVVSAEKRLAFLVDEVLRELEVLVKPLGRQLIRVRNIMGATVLENGKVVPVLNVSDLLKTAVKMRPAFTAESEKGPEKPGSVLVVEDSITARMLLKNIIESAGYDVRTAVDGADALSALKGRAFDIVVSDVEMPGMDGFELTATIRSDKQLAELPVVLVTALESGTDRERGIDVGANAYIVKSSFDQNNLLEVIERLI